MATIKRRHVKAVIQLRRATEVEWYALNPILRLGEPAFSTDIYKLKIGDGYKRWRQIDYLNDRETREIIDRIDNLGYEDITHGEVTLINCGTSTTVV